MFLHRSAYFRLMLFILIEYGVDMLSHHAPLVLLSERSAKEGRPSQSRLAPVLGS